MNGRIRLAVLAPLAVSSLALASVPFSAASAQAVAPSASCHVTQMPDGGFNVIGRGLTPGAAVKARLGAFAIALRAGADGGLQSPLSTSAASGPVTLQEEGGPQLTCGTVGQAEQKDAQDQFNKGFKDGFNSGKELCGQALQQGLQGLVPLDPNYQKGFTAGSNSAIAQFC